MKKITIITFILICLTTVEMMAQKSQSVLKLNRELRRVENIDSLLNYQISEMNRLYERSVYFRMMMVDFASQLKADPEKPLDSQSLYFFKSNTNVFMKLRDSLLSYTYRYENTMRLSQSSLKRKNITELERTKAVMLSTACALILYDNYLLGVVLLEQDTRIRRLANASDKGFDVSPNQLHKITKSANSSKNQKRIIKGIEFVERREKLFANESDKDYLFLLDLINSSPSRDYLKRIDYTGYFSKKIRLSQIFISDLMAGIGNNSLNGLSKFFGNTTGLVETRKGKMYKDLDLKQEILKELQPLDILLEKTPFRLTDKFIPGYFGHVAIWVGNGFELDSIGVWDHEVIQKYHADVAPNDDLKSENGKIIIEALRDGVKLSTLDDFLNVDDFVILRPVFQDSLSYEQKKESLLLAFRQIGKEYDFNFDINTTDKIVCSELAYICYPKINWTTEKVVGRHTISPDNVASLVWESNQMELVSFYHNGVKSEEKGQEKLLKQLILGEN